MKRPKQTVEQNVLARITKNRDRVATQAQMTARRAELEVLAPTREKERLAKENR